MIRTPAYQLYVNAKNLDDDIYRKIEKVVFVEPKDGEENFTIYLKDHDFSVQDSGLFVEEKTVVSLFMGYTDDIDFMMDGIVSNIIPDYPNDGEPTLEIKVQNIANVMNRLEKNKKYVGKTYSDIAKSVAKDYGLKHKIDDTKSIYSPKYEKGECLIQPGMSDWLFLQEIASRIKFKCFIRKGVLYFVKDKELIEHSNVVLEYRVGSCNLLSFRPNLSTSNKNKKMTLSNIDILKKNIVSEKGVQTVGGNKTVIKETDKKNDSKVATKQKVHTVKKGEYLSKIAKQYYGDGTKWQKIAQANPSVKAPDYKIGVGQKLIIP